MACKGCFSYNVAWLLDAFRRRTKELLFGNRTLYLDTARVTGPHGAQTRVLSGPFPRSHNMLGCLIFGKDRKSILIRGSPPWDL
ncbi:unnamed protein product [Lota lota]